MMTALPDEHYDADWQLADIMLVRNRLIECDEDIDAVFGTCCHECSILKVLPATMFCSDDFVSRQIGA